MCDVSRGIGNRRKRRKVASRKRRNRLFDGNSLFACWRNWVLYLSNEKKEKAGIAIRF